MDFWVELLTLAGGVCLFLYGLKKLSREAGDLFGGKLGAFVRSATKTRIGGVVAGALPTALLQSSVAVNVVAVTLVEKGIIDFVSCCAVIMGTNVGTTVTAQLVSLSSVFDFDVGIIGSTALVIGSVLVVFSVNERRARLKNLGGSIIGLGFMFIGLSSLSVSVSAFSRYKWFVGLFKIRSPLVLFLNGLVVTAALQSSSAVTSMIILLSASGLITFDRAAMIILGANAGSCVPVWFASTDMGDEARKSTFFNFAFNVFGALAFIPPLCLFGAKINLLPYFSFPNVGKAIADFHTFFNVITTVAVLPVLGPFCAFVERVFNIINGREKLKKSRVKTSGETFFKTSAKKAAKNR